MKIKIDTEVNKLGIDIHGVLDCNPRFFVSQATEILKKKGEVHIITGIPYSKKVEKELLGYNKGKKYWTHFFSIESYLVMMNTPYELDKNGRKSFDPNLWNRVKAHYCAERKIDLHYDDSPEYAQYFSTPIMLFMPNPTARKPPVIFDNLNDKSLP